MHKEENTKTKGEISMAKEEIIGSLGLCIIVLLTIVLICTIVKAIKLNKKQN